MPIIPPTATTPQFALVVFDAEGRELAEADGTALSETLARRVARDEVTDVVLMCHGWLDDLAEAEAVYRGWLGTAHGLSWPGPTVPLVVAAHWPSRPFASDEPPDIPAALSRGLRNGTLIAALDNAGVELTDFLSFWSMRQRALALGAADAGLGRLLARIVAARPAVRVHLVGHSLGCVALSGALVSSDAHAASLMLLQAAESSWAFSQIAPFLPAGVGRYRAVISRRLIDGAMVATTSRHDTALGVLYRLGMEFVLQRSYAEASRFRPARSAAIGAEGFGFDPALSTVHALPALEPGASDFALAAGQQYTIDCSAVIADHNDVGHVELARLFFAAAGVGGGLLPEGRTDS